MYLQPSSFSTLLLSVLIFPILLINLASSSALPLANGEHSQLSQDQVPFTTHENDQPSPWFDESFDELVQQLLNLFNVPGLAISIVDNGNISSKVSLIAGKQSSGLD